LDADDLYLPFKSESFGCVTALDIVEHTKDRAKTIAEISRLTKDQGLFIVGTPITDTVAGKVWGKYLDKDVSHVSKPSRAELFTDLENAGFEILEYHYYFPLPFARLRLPRTNIEVVARKTSKDPLALRDIHIQRFPKDKFLEGKT
jgi:SAM-dependent methyltransferase